jgi:type III pantothenate kinase
MSTWNLYLNLGNSSTQWGIWSDEGWLAEGREPGGRPLVVLRQIADAAAGHELAPADLGAVAACSSSSQVGPWVNVCFTLLQQPLLLMGSDFSADYPSDYYRPAQWGLDRKANAWGLRAEGTFPALVLDAGTCLTADVFAADGRHRGGAIAPGLPAARLGLGVATPHLRGDLPELPLVLDEQDPGRDTRENLRLGLLASLGGTAQALVGMFGEMTGDAAQVILTGGDADLLRDLLETPATVRENLTLEGVRLAHQESVAVEA